MNIDEGIKANLAKLLNLPRDVILKLPNFYLLGNLSLAVENHRGLLKYSESEISLRVYQGKTIITGQKLEIESLTKDLIVINGQIKSIVFKLA